jgi:hypothetical protein
MHVHAYLYAGKHGVRPRFDATRLDPEGALFATSPFPPNFLAHWLLKPRKFIHHTWEDPAEAAKWGVDLYRQVYKGYETRCGSTMEQYEESAVEQLAMGNDVLLATNGLAGPDYKEIYLICCPNAGGTARCPEGRTDKRPKGATVMTGVP